MPRRPPDQAIGESTAVFDEIWDGLHSAGEGHAGVPKEHRMQITTTEDELVRLEHGKVVRRFTREELEEKLTPEQLDDLQVLEKSMEINRVLWREKYPNRVLNASDRQLAEQALHAMAEDLEAVLKYIEAAGFELDDHYASARSILAAYA